MYVYQIVYPKGLELVQPSECVPNLSCHRGDPVWYYRKLLRHNNNTIKCKKKTNGRKKEIGKKDDQALGVTSIKLLRDFIAFRFPTKLGKFQIL